MSFFGLFGKKKKVEKLTSEEEEYASHISWDTLFIEYFNPTSINGMLQKLATIYKKSNGVVENNAEFQKLQKELNNENKQMFNPIVNYKLLFDKYLADVEYEELTEEEQYLSFEEAIRFIDDYVKEESKERQKAIVTKQNEIAKTHRCSVHNQPIEYGFEVDGLNLCIAVTKECCSQSFKELASKLK